MPFDPIALFNFIRELIADCKNKQSLSDNDVLTIARKNPLRLRMSIHRALREQGLRGSELREATSQAINQIDEMSAAEILEFSASCGAD